LLIGFALVGGVLVVAALLFLQNALLRSQVTQLEPYEAEAAALKAQLEVRQQAQAGIRDTNQQLVSALTSGRSSSALLTALQLNTPQGVQLTSVDSSGPTLVVKGLAYDPLALVRINAFQLQLTRMPLFDGKAVELTKVERQPSTTPAPVNGQGPPGLPVPGPLSFEIHAPFATLDAQRQLALLQQFGSEGMARRLELLRSEGLMP
jgi:Tfp pilus assembly protein PilN